jgi:Radical SAM superfamily/Iron-sulfur cluster-binding domain
VTIGLDHREKTGGSPMEPALREDYDRTRDFAGKAFRSVCYAPFTSLYLDTMGNARVCCHNVTYPVGNVGQSSLREIWRGPRIAAIRSALREGNFGQGCSYCEWQLESRVRQPPDPQMGRVPGGLARAGVTADDRVLYQQRVQPGMRDVQRQVVVADPPAAGEAPPLPDPYSDAFFAELREALPHLNRAKFLGGEPFLQEHCFRIWDMLIEDAIPLPCHVTTNGTLFNARVEQVLDRLPVGVAVSVDGFTKETVEAIRVNARHEVVWANIDRFREYARTRGTSFSLTYCLMRQNWRELAPFFAFAEDLQCPVFINTVRFPAGMSLYTLPAAELSSIVAAMKEQEAALLPALSRNGRAWSDQLQSLSRHASGSVALPGLTRPTRSQSPEETLVSDAGP